MTEYTLQIQNLSVGYDETTIIEDLNLEIPAHKVSGDHWSERLRKIHPDENPFTIVETWKRTGGSGRKSSSQLSFYAAGADAWTSSPVSNSTGGNHGGRFGRTWTISIPEVHAEYDQRGLCRS